MTSKEYKVADYLGDRYFLYVVRGFETPKPCFTLIRNPLSSGLCFEKHEIVSSQTFWTGDVSADVVSNCF